MKPFKRAILSTIFAASCVSAAWAEGQYWAVVVGVDEYIREGIPKLRYAVADAKLFSQVLQTAVKVPKQNIFLLTSDSVQENSQPKLTNIASQLDDLRKLVKPDDTVIFYFAGHGITIGGESYLLTEESDNRNPTTLRLSSLKSREVTLLLKDLGVKRGMVIMDACRNSPGSTASKIDSSLQDDQYKAIDASSLGKEQGTAIFSCSVGEKAWEWDEKKHGFFSYFLAEGLSQTTDPTGKVTLRALLDDVSEKVKTQTQAITKVKQTPTRNYSGPGDGAWVLATLAPSPGVKVTKSTDKVVAKLEQLQAKLDREVALRVAAEQRATTEASKRAELEQRLALMEKRIPNSPDNGLALEYRNKLKAAESELSKYKEQNIVAYADRSLTDPALRDQAVATENARLKAENEVLRSKLGILEAQAAPVAVASSRSIEFAEQVEKSKAELEKASQSQDSLGGSLAERRLLEAQVALAESRLPSENSQDPEVVKLKSLLEYQILTTEASKQRVAHAESAAQEYSIRLRETELKLEEAQSQLSRLPEIQAELDRTKSENVELRKRVELLEERRKSSGDNYVARGGNKKQLLNYQRPLRLEDAINTGPEPSAFPTH
jgi:uncharacterized caspase-like protein